MEIIIFDTLTQASAIDDKSIVDAQVIFGRTKIYFGHALLYGLVQILLAFVFAREIRLPLHSCNKENQNNDDPSAI